MPETNLPDALLKIGLALAKHHIKNVIGDEALEVVADTLTDVGGEKVQAKVDSIFASKEGKKELLKAAKVADEKFREKCRDNDLRQLFTMGYGNLPSLQEAIAGLPEALDDETLRETLFKAFRNDAPKGISDEKINEGVDLYVECLQNALLPVAKFGQRIIHNALKQIGKDVKVVQTDVKDIKMYVRLLLQKVRKEPLPSIMSGERLYKKFANTPVLSAHIRTEQFQALIDERTRNFVGRDFLFRTIEKLTIDPLFPSGYIIVSGEPGIGKTAFIAELVKRKGYVHHFNLALQNIRTAADFLSNICAQLIIRYDLDHFILTPDATKDSGFLSQLLSEVTKKEKGKPTIILVDALDEVDDTGIKPAENILYFPSSLPKGIYFLVTTREAHDYRLSVDRQKDISLEDNDLRNLKDIRQYVLNYIQSNRAQMNVRIQEWKISLDEFVKIITKKSEGNFMYVVHVLNDILEGKLAKVRIDNVHDLPNGLRSYYQRHWRMMRAEDEAKFDRYQEPVICFLATAREPVGIEYLQEWTGLSPRQIQNVINDWRQFLNTDHSHEEPRYRIYHASFQDFLKAEVGLDKYHDQIVTGTFRKIPGFLDRKN